MPKTPVDRGAVEITGEWADSMKGDLFLIANDGQGNWITH